MASITIDAAMQYLKEDPARRLKCLYNTNTDTLFPGFERQQTRTIFYNSDRDLFGVLLKGRRRQGELIDWSKVKKIFGIKREMSKEECNVRLIRKYKRHAAKATFTNPWIRKILEADPTKSPYENGITTGVPIEGKIISFKAIRKAEPYLEDMFRKAFAEKREWHSYRFPFRGYEASLWTGTYKETGEACGGLNLEYKGCVNGYYYLLVNDEEFIGYDID